METNGPQIKRTFGEIPKCIHKVSKRSLKREKF